MEYLKLALEKRQSDAFTLAICEDRLGECFENGIGVKKSDQDALQFYQQAAEHGNRVSQIRLGDAYRHGELGLEKLPANAIHFYNLAVNQGSWGALECLGECYEAGEGVEQSHDIAFQYYQSAFNLARENGDHDGAFSLAHCYEQGIGTEKSLENAVYYYKLAGDNGNAYGYSMAAKCCRELGGAENEKKASVYSKLDTETRVVEMKRKHHIHRNFFKKIVLQALDSIEENDSEEMEEEERDFVEEMEEFDPKSTIFEVNDWVNFERQKALY